MSPSEMAFNIRAVNWEGGQTDDATLLKVFDGYDRFVGEGQGQVSLSLPKGLITVQAERLGALKNQTFAHAADSSAAAHEIVVQRRNSAMPTVDTLHTHEFFQEASVRYSTESTWAVADGGPDNNARLMILIRASGAGSSAEIFPAKSLTLFDDAGNVVTMFEPHMTARQQHEGWVAFSAKLAPGGYILADHNEAGTRSLPLTVHDGWSTLVFVPFERRPRIAASSITIIGVNDPFDPENKLLQHVDAAIQGLGQRLNLLDKQLANEAIHGKFEDPLLGLIGAYAHFLGDQRKERLERQVLRNMWRLLPGSVDVLAVLLLALERECNLPRDIASLNDAASEAFGDHWNEDVPIALPLRFPPMLRPGMAALTRASRHFPGLIEEESWIEAAALSSYAEGVWAVWEQQPDLAEFQSMPEVAPAEPPVSRQRLYPLLRSAAERLAPSISSTVKAADRVRTLVSDSDDFADAMGGLIGEMSDRLPGISLSVDKTVVTENELVRDLVRRIQSSAQALADHPIRLKPETNVPKWLLAFVERHYSEDDSDLTKIAELADVPLRSVQQAINKLRD